MRRRFLLCDGCYEAATGTAAVCQDGCRGPLDHAGTCLEPGWENCSWCGRAGRLTPADRSLTRTMPTAGEQSEGCWYLRWPGEGQGPYPSQDAVWDAWHETGWPTAKRTACLRCGLPAAFTTAAVPVRQLCAVCAANAAADGEEIMRIEELDHERAGN